MWFPRCVRGENVEKLPKVSQGLVSGVLGEKFANSFDRRQSGGDKVRCGGR